MLNKIQSLTISILTFFVFIEILYPQISKEFCGTIIPEGTTLSIAKGYGSNENLSNYERTEMTPPLRLAIHILRRSDGTGGMNLNTLFSSVQNLNYHFSQASFQFEIYSIDYIDSDDYYNLVGWEEVNSLRQMNVKNGCINIYFVNMIYINGYELCGLSSFSNDPIQGIVMNKSSFCSLSSIFAHQ